MDGILLIDKPTGMTSHDVVAIVRGILRKAASPKPQDISQTEELSALSSRLTAPLPKVKVGHTGTLDPAASGLMILVLGKYTKQAGEFSKLDKTYEAELTLGSTSTTGDREGEITEVGDRGEGIGDSKKPTKKALEAVLGQFEGKIQQTPPIYSAVKINGQRAYKLAREGKEVIMQPRQVTVYRLQVTDYSYPILKLTTEVSSGTYIRSLAEDIGTKLGTGAYMSNLRRTKVGKFDIKDAYELDDLTVDNLSTKVLLK